jgi:hypothetical protein
MIKLGKESLNSDVEQFHQSMSTKRKIQVLAWEGTNMLINASPTAIQI